MNVAHETNLTYMQLPEADEITGDIRLLLWEYEASLEGACTRTSVVQSKSIEGTASGARKRTCHQGVPVTEGFGNGQKHFGGRKSYLVLSRTSQYASIEF